MFRYIIRRLIQAIPILIGISILSFVLVSLTPGDPVSLRTAGNRNITPEAKEVLRRQLGLDQPLLTQYIRWLAGITIRPGNAVEEFSNDTVRCTHLAAIDYTGCDTGGGVLRGDLGTSIDTKEPVWERMTERMWATLELGLISLLISLLIGVPLGVLSAVYRGSLFDNFVRVFAVLFRSVPVYWMGLLLLLVLPCGWAGCRWAGGKRSR